VSRQELLDLISTLWNDVIAAAANALWEEFKDDLQWALILGTWILIKSSGRTIETGSTGLLFSFGRATRVLRPGFHFLLPFLQVARTLPTRSRTMDLPKQIVQTVDGLVYEVDANLVYRVDDVRKAIVQIDDIEKGLSQILGLMVQEVLRGLAREDLRTVERAGVTSLAPSRVTLRLTQLAPRVEERQRLFERLTESGLAPLPARPLAARGRLPRRRAVRARSREWAAIRSRRVRNRLRRSAAVHGVTDLRVVRDSVRAAMLRFHPRGA
jgi:hypothetical protein